MKKTLDIALAKLKPCVDSKEWFACLTHSEIVELHRNGYREKAHKRDKILEKFRLAWADVKKGGNGKMWVYYEVIGKDKPKFNRVKK